MRFINKPLLAVNRRAVDRVLTRDFTYIASILLSREFTHDLSSVASWALRNANNARSIKGKILDSTILAYRHHEHNPRLFAIKQYKSHIAPIITAINSY